MNGSALIIYYASKLTLQYKVFKYFEINHYYGMLLTLEYITMHVTRPIFSSGVLDFTPSSLCLNDKKA